MLGGMRQDLPQTFARGQLEGELGHVQRARKRLGRCGLEEAHKPPRARLPHLFRWLTLGIVVALSAIAAGCGGGYSRAETGEALSCLDGWHG